MLTALLVWGAARPLRAQTLPAPLALTNTEDARTLPMGTIRLRALNVWTRYDGVFGGDTVRGVRPLGSAFSSLNLGVREIPTLVPAELALRTLTGDPTIKINVGRLGTTANSRVVVTPIALDVGVTDRLTMGVMVPVVQTHTEVLVQLNPRGLPNSANVGPNPVVLPSGAGAALINQVVLAGLSAAQGQLQSALVQCATNPGGSICSRQTEAAQALATADAYRGAIQVLYGVDATASPFAPTGATQAAIAANLAALDAQFQSLLGQSFIPQMPQGAAGLAAQLQFQGLATGTLARYDSVGSPDRIGVGDVELSAALRLFDTFRDTLHTSGFHYRATVRGVMRLGTGQPPTGTVPFEIGTGTGQSSFDGGVVADLRAGRVLTTVYGQYTANIGSTSVNRAPNSEYALFPLTAPAAATWRAGNAVQAEVTPRFMWTDYLTLDAHYVLRWQAASSYTTPGVTAAPVFAATTQQMVGMGFGYSTISRYQRRRTSVPLEVFYSHLETIAANGGLVPKYTRDQIEVRIYYRLLR